MAIGSHEANELHHLDEWPRGGLGHAESVEHLARLQPTIRMYGLLCDIGEHRIGAAEGDHGRFAEEDTCLDENVLSAKHAEQDCQGDEPQNQANDRYRASSQPRRSGMGRTSVGQERVDHPCCRGGSMALDHQKGVEPETATDIPDQGSRQDN